MDPNWRPLLYILCFIFFIFSIFIRLCAKIKEEEREHEPVILVITTTSELNQTEPVNPLQPTQYSDSDSSKYPPSGSTHCHPAGPSTYPPAYSEPYPLTAGDYNCDPPSYDVAMSAPLNQPLHTTEGYGK